MPFSTRRGYYVFDRPSLIYGLTDPRDGSVRYVGRSTSPAGRFYGHAADRRSVQRPKGAWLAELHRLGLRPRLVFLDVAPPNIIGVHDELERRWIKRGLAQGWPLTNDLKKSHGYRHGSGGTQ